MSVYEEPFEWVKESIDSILNQTYPDIEFIIILDNPNNINLNLKIKNYIKNNTKAIILHNEKNIGLARSLNRGIEYSTGDYIARMDADDISNVIRIEKQIKFLQHNKDISLVGSNMEKIDESGSGFGVMALPSDKNLLKELASCSTISFHPTWMFRKSILNELNGYRPFPASQDYDFILRLSDQGFFVSNIQENLLKHRINKNSISNKKSLLQLKLKKYIIELHKERIATGIDTFSLDKMNNVCKLNKFENSLHIKANKFYISSIKHRDNDKYLLFIIHLFSAIVISRYYLANVISYFKIKKIMAKNTNFSFTVNELEKLRYGRYVLPNNTKNIYYEDIRSWWKLLFVKNINRIFIFGERPPDMASLKYALKKSKHVVFLQHAKNEIRKKHTFNYYIKNRIKLFYWIFYVVFFKFIEIFNFRKRKDLKIDIYYYTVEYKDSLSRKLSLYNTNFIKCAHPDVTKFGTLTDMKINKKPIRSFYIDEPLADTLGISREAEIKIIEELIKKIGLNVTLYVKLHPRSNGSKFDELKEVVIVDEVYQNCQILCGYNSGLLDFDFNNKMLYRLSNKLIWVLKENSSTEKNITYISDVKLGVNNNDL